MEKVDNIKEETFFKDMALRQRDSMDFVSSDAAALARRLRKTDWKLQEDKFKVNCIEASYFINAFKIAGASFKAMTEKIQADPKCRDTALDFMMDEIVKLKKKELDMEKRK